AAWRETRARWSELFVTAHERAQRGQLPWVAHLKGRTKAWAFERGFVGHLALFSKRFVAEGGTYFERAPVTSVKFVQLTSRVGTVTPAALFACPHLARIAKLDLDGSSLGAREAQQLADSPHIQSLRALGLGGHNLIPERSVPALLAAAPDLTELSFARNVWLKTDHALALAGCPAFAAVASLDLTSCMVIAEGVRALVAGPHARGALQVLRLAAEEGFESERGVPFRARADGVQVCEVVADSKALGSLRVLNLNFRNIGPGGLEVLAGGAKSLPALRELHLEACGLSITAVKVLARSALGPQLLYLNLRDNPALRRYANQLAGLFPAAQIEEP
ncbi:MAG TPA: hypothetical protein VGE74_22190, partial [Gemmata sp.]